MGMKKKIIFIIPIIFLLVNVANFSLYHQNIYYSRSRDSSSSLKQLLQIRPSNWKLYKVIYTTTYHGVEMPVIITNMGIVTTNKKVALTNNANFIGFPFAFYFKTNSPPKTGSLLTPQSISAYSLYWFILDLIIFIVLSILVFFIYMYQKNHTSSN